MKHFLAVCLIAMVVIVLPAMAACPKANPNVYNKIFPMNPTDAPELPRIPHTFGGCVLINDRPAPEGTQVCVVGDGVRPDCITTDATGCFGRGTFDLKLMATGYPVPGKGMINVKEGTQLYFFVNGHQARICLDDTCYSTIQYHSGHHTVLTLSITVPETSCCRN